MSKKKKQEKERLPRLNLYTDGSVSTRGVSTGGWAFVLTDEYENVLHIAYDKKENTTISRMELVAIREGVLHIIENYPNHYTQVHSDSMYAVKSINKWMHKWKYQNWETPDGEPRKHADIFKVIERINKKHKIYYKHVRSHSGNKFNDLADEYANIGRTK